ncbi:MAG: 30S ribosomal protein S2 [Candidatus Omnitrophica bacterium]|nr:30S ribosomal protein S2 [Candidatus Omnitrophota bacterium]
MSQVTLKQLLEAGVHFGHQTSRWNPKMKKYIFGERNGIYIINLEITLSCLDRAINFLKAVATEGKEILFIGTKKQAQEPLRDAAERCGMPYVNQRWLGGALTNFETVRKSVRRLDDIDKMESEGISQFVTKKEVLELRKEREKLMKNLVGIRNMKRLPGAAFVIDSKKEENAIKEAVKLGIPIVAVLDTNCDPDLVDYPLPGNDDAIRAIKLFCELAAQSIQEGRRQAQIPLVAKEERIASAETPESTDAADSDSEAAADSESIEIIPDAIEEKLAERFEAGKDVLVEKDTKLKVKKPGRKDSGRSK